MTSVTGMNIIGLALQAVMRRRGNGIAMSVLKVQKYPSGFVACQESSNMV